MDWLYLVSGLLVANIAAICLILNVAMNELFWRGWRDK